MVESALDSVNVFINKYIYICIYIPPWHFSFNILLTSFWRTVSFIILCILQTSETVFQGRKKFKPLSLPVCLFSSAPPVVSSPCCPLRDSCQRSVLPHLCPASPPMTSPQRMKSGTPAMTYMSLRDLPRPDPSSQVPAAVSLAVTECPTWGPHLALFARPLHLLLSLAGNPVPWLFSWFPTYFLEAPPQLSLAEGPSLTTLFKIRLQPTTLLILLSFPYCFIITNIFSTVSIPHWMPGAQVCPIFFFRTGLGPAELEFFSVLIRNADSWVLPLTHWIRISGHFNTCCRQFWCTRKWKHLHCISHSCTKLYPSLPPISSCELSFTLWGHWNFILSLHVRKFLWTLVFSKILSWIFSLPYHNIFDPIDTKFFQCNNCINWQPAARLRQQLCASLTVPLCLHLDAGPLRWGGDGRRKGFISLSFLDTSRYVQAK